MMPILSIEAARLSRVFDRVFSFSICRFLTVILLISAPVLVHAASVHGVVTAPTGARIGDATVSLISNGKIVGSAVSSSDGSFQITTGTEGRFFLVVSAKTFRQLETPDFYAGRLDMVERNLVVEPEWVRQSIVVTATGVPTPQAQTSETTSVLSPQDLAQREDLVTALRLMPGTVVVQEGQLGAQTSLFVRGGNSTANKVLLDGVSVDDMGGQFDFGTLATTAVERVEVYRGANSSLYGADAGSSVVSLKTTHGTTNFPSLMAQAEAGNFNASREEATLAGAYKKLDYLGAFSWLQSGNALPNDEYHSATTAANLGWQLNANTQIRGTLHYGVDATGVPNAWNFYGVADSATEKDQDLFLSASIDNQTTSAFHNTLRYGAARKREQYTQWAQVGSNFDAYGDSLGNTVTITGANGTTVTGQAILDYAGLYPSEDQLVNNRDQLVYQADYRLTPHLTALLGFHYENERGSYLDPAYFMDEQSGRTNYDYLAGFHGDFKNRFFYTLGGSVEKYSLFGLQGSPRLGLSYYALKPSNHIFSGTRLLFNYSDGVREPKLTDQFGSLYQFLTSPLVNLGSVAQQLHITALAAPTTRTYEGGVAQGFWGDRVVFRASYFHNQFGREIESVPAPTLLTLIPGLTQKELGVYYTYDEGLYVNTEAFRVQGFETTVESGIGHNLFLRGGYTYLDSLVQRSFSSDNQALLGGYSPTYNGIPIGAYSPLVGARPFRRPPHTGFITANYTEKKLTASLAATFSSRSDDSTYLLDANFGSSLLLPNRNLDFGYAKLDLGGNYQLLPWLSAYVQGQNLLSNQHIGPIGYPSLPFTARAGLRIALGKSNNH